MLPKERLRLPLKEEVYREQDRGRRPRLQPFRGEDGFRIGAGNFAHGNPAEATNQRANQKRDRCERNQAKKPEDERKRAVQNFADSN